ncbi:MAG: hypothetical protein Q8K75_07465 [Chlamydiales bacterium]|nr:hypothetical protein [Chlamydiales bacterium]
MFNLFSKNRLSALVALLSLSTANSSLMAWEYDYNRTYVGVYGGGIYSNSSKMNQMGTAFFTEAQGGPLAVNARGDTSSTSSGFGGLQMGYEWSQYPMYIGYSDWSIAPSLEVEGYWYSLKKEGHLFNETDRLEEHDFLDTFHMNAGVYLANAVFSLDNPSFGALSPYVGLGLGATRIYIRNATSTQVEPPEVGVNHFSAKTSDSSWAFAAQVKTGLRFQVCESLHVFGEYRYLFVDSSNYIFGSTVFPGHAATSPWNVKVKSIHYNAFAFGIQYDL